MPTQIHQLRPKLYWTSFGLLVILIRWWLSRHPQWVETVYSNGWYIIWRKLVDPLTDIVPFALMFVIVGAVVIWLIIRVIRWYRRGGKLRHKLISALMFLLSFVSGLIGIFMLVWGMNYSRIPIEEHLGMELSARSEESLWMELDRRTKDLIALRQNLSIDTSEAFSGELYPNDREEELRTHLQKKLTMLGYRADYKVRGKLIYPKGLYLRFSSAGLFFPFSGEGTIDAGLHPLEQPFVIAHEMGHGYGFGDEGTCNFWAYLATQDHPDKAIRYAGQLSYWRTLAINCLRYDRDRYQILRADLPSGIIADLNAINENAKKYPDLMPKLRYQAYNAYLKSQGIKEGMANYNRVLMLVDAWEKR